MIGLLLRLTGVSTVAELVEFVLKVLVLVFGVWVAAQVLGVDLVQVVQGWLRDWLLPDL